MTANQTMNLFLNIIKNSLFPSLSWVRALFNQRQSFIPHLSLTPYILYLLLSVSLLSCIDENLSCPDGHVSSDMIAVDLPAVMAISLNSPEQTDTRGDFDTSTSDDKRLDDGIRAEYAIASPEGKEYYNYLLLYDSSNSNSYPIIFPIDDTWDKEWDATSPYNHLTLSISKVFQNGLTGNIKGDNQEVNFNGKEDLYKYLEGMDAYVLLNFKLIDGYTPNYILNGTEINGKTTVEKLASLKKSDFENLQMLDYKISATDKTTGTSTNYLIMSNSVYAQHSNKVGGGMEKVVSQSFDASKFYSTADQAAVDPSLNVWVERIASKITVEFDITKMGQVNFDPYGGQSLIAVTQTDDSNRGLPLMELSVQRVDMEVGTQTGITFNETDGYKINSVPIRANIKILGFGISNTEESTPLFKDINAGMDAEYYKWNWNEPGSHRSYWARDYNYQLTPASNEYFTRAAGYTHQFRLALDTDSVSSLHTGLRGSQKGYKNFLDPETYTLLDQNGKSIEYKAYTTLGQIDETKTIDLLGQKVCLKYKSFDQLNAEFQNLGYSKSSYGNTSTYTYSPIYSFENTYWDRGMSNFDWTWAWQREPYATATNLIVLAQIEFPDNTSTGGVSADADGGENPSTGQDEGDSTVDIPTTFTPRTVYLGQNNIFYLRKVNLLKSKLAILNDVILPGGNAGLQILHGQWDRHIRWDEDDENQNKDTHLDKVAWNEGSKLWIAELKWSEKDKGPVYELKTTKDEKGNDIISYDFKFESQWIATVDNSSTAKEDDQDLDLIPAEISGGDGQCLIAPNEKWMGAKYKYYLAPEAAEKDEDGKPVMDKSLAVEISYNHLVALIHKIIGPVDVFYEGKMYYSIPIPHRISNYGPGRNENQWRNLGAFSLVRNNWYNITVDAITRLGTPVHVPTQPIVPVMDVKRSYINMGVKLKEWHNITQDNIPMM